MSARGSASQNGPHHGAAGVEVDFKTDWPPPLPCMRWFAIVALRLIATKDFDAFTVVLRKSIGVGQPDQL
jgi:hypothetical protein